MRKSELKQIIREELLRESLGGGIMNHIEGMYDYVSTLTNAKYVSEQEAERLTDSIDALRKIWVKTLKGKGLSGI